VDSVWQDRPASAQGPNSAFVLSEEAAGGEGRSVRAKMEALATWCKGEDVDGYIVSALDDVCWLLNIRGNAIPCVPVIIAYAIVLRNKANDAPFPTNTTLFVDPAVVGAPAVQEHLKASHVTVLPYEQFFTELQKLAEAGTALASLTDTTSRATMAAMKARPAKRCAVSPFKDPRAVKTPAEISNMARAHLQDSLSAVRLFAYLDAGLRDGTITSMSEWNVCEKLEEIRQRTPDYLGPSFFTIAGYGQNGAIVHYEPSAEHPGINIGTDSMLLLDFGGQYAYGGTTDTTRTVHFGTPTPEQRETFTQVLRSHIALAKASFPASWTRVSDLDAIARTPLWAVGKNFGHGTGHGVGSFLTVHEKPIISSRDTSFVQPGMMLTIEPGLYLEGQFGVRIESVGTVVQHPSYAGFLSFDVVTRVPISPKLVEPALLTSEEKAWLNSYNQLCLASLSPLLTSPDDALTLAYLQAECTPVQ